MLLRRFHRATLHERDHGPGPDDGDPVAPQGFRAVTVVVTLPDGRTREWCMWLADTPELRAQGLMGVTDPGLGGAAGMVFAFPGDTSAGFWMKDTPMPLSIAWYPVDGPLVSTADMEPCPAGTANCPVYEPGGPYRYAVEVPQGTLSGFGLVEGSRLALGDACEPGDPPAALSRRSWENPAPVR